MLDIFERVNSGEPLTRQQMRNCLFTGPATQFLKKEAATEIFKSATGNSLNPKTMRDRELINRFCAFYLLELDTYKGNMDDFLAQALREMNNFDLSQLDKLSSKFKTSMANNKIVFGKHAFRKHTPGKDSRSVINASLWDVMSTGLAGYPEHLVKEKSKLFKEAFYNLLDDIDFDNSITLGTNQLSRVSYRFTRINELLQEVFGDYTD